MKRTIDVSLMDVRESTLYFTIKIALIIYGIKKTVIEICNKQVFVAVFFAF